MRIHHLLLIATFLTLLTHRSCIAFAQEATQPVLLSEEEQGWLKANPSIRVGIVPTPPYTFLKDGRNQGYLIDVMQLLAAQAGVTPEYSLQALPETFAQVKNGQLHAVLGIMRNEERAGFLYFSENVLKLQMAIFARTSRSDIRDAASLKNKIIATRKGYGLEHVVKKYLPDAKIITAEDAEGMLQLVASGEADATIRELHSGEYILYNSFINNVNVKGLFTPPGLPKPIGAEFAVSKKFPLLNSILNKAYKAIPESEKIEVWRKWFASVEPQEKTIELTPEEQTWLDQSHTVRVRALDWPPYLVLKENEPVQGISAEYLKLIKERTGINFEYAVTRQPFAEFLEAMKLRSSPDMTLVIARVPEREDYISFSKPYITTTSVIFAHEEDELIVDINELAGKSLALPRGYNVQRILTEGFPDVKLVLFDSDLEALQAVTLHEVDAYIGNLVVATHIIQQHGLSDLKVIGSAPYGEQTLCIGNRKDWPELTSIVDKALANITEVEKTAIHKKYVAVRYETGIESSVVLKVVLALAVTAVAVILLFVAWNRTLKKTVARKTAALANEINERKISQQKVQEHQQRLKALASQLIIAEEQERRSIAADLHDDVSQNLVLSNLQLEAVIKSSDDASVKEKLETVSDMLFETTRETRQLIFELSSPTVDDIGLGAAVNEWADSMLKKSHDIDFELIDKLAGITIEKNLRAILYRNVRELLTNTLKYAKANKVGVVLDRVDGQIIVTVQDNGVGFNSDYVINNINRDGGFGFFSIQERMSDFGGKLEIRSSPHRGCTITMSAPYEDISGGPSA